MRKFLIIYLVISALIFGIVYLVTAFVITQERMLEVFMQKAEAALEDDDLEGFLKFQSLGFKHIQSFEDETYEIHLYQILAKQEDAYVNQLSVFVMPKTEIKHATDIADVMDDTSIYLFDTIHETLILDSLLEVEAYDYAVSYNIERIGFYYYAIRLIEDHELLLRLYDYDQVKFYESVFDFTYQMYDGVSFPTGFIQGYSNEEVDVLLDMPTHLSRPMTRNLSVFLIADAMIGILTYQWLVKKKSIKKHANPS